MAINLALPGKKSSQTVIFIVPILWLLVLIALSYFSAKAGVAKIKSQRVAIANAKKMENILSEKESILKSVVSETPKYVNPVSIALPDKNPALFLISQVKNLAAQSSTVLTDFKIGSGSEGAESKVSLSCVISGSYFNILAFLRATETVAPILGLKKLDISLDNDMGAAEIAMDVYWSEFPDKIPSVTDPISKLTSKNYETLNKVVGLTPPIFTTLPPMGPTDRQNPFY